MRESQAWTSSVRTSAIRSPISSPGTRNWLTAARVIERAKRGELVDGSGATCAELESIIAVDKKAIKFEKDKLEALGSAGDPKTKAAVAEAEAAIEKQIKKLQGLQGTKKCAK